MDIPEQVELMLMLTRLGSNGRWEFQVREHEHKPARSLGNFPSEMVDHFRDSAHERLTFQTVIGIVKHPLTTILIGTDDKDGVLHSRDLTGAFDIGLI